MADIDMKMLGSLLGVDPTDANAVSEGVRTLLGRMGAKDLTLALTAENAVMQDFRHDMLGVAIDQTGSETAAAALSATAGGDASALQNGWLAGATDDVDNELDNVALGSVPWMNLAQISTGKVAVGEIGFCIPSALTARQYFFGLSDAPSEATTTNGPLNIQTGTTVVDVATNAAGFIFSSLATDADGFYAAETNAGTQALVENTGLTGVVDDYIILRVEVDTAGDVAFLGATDTTRDVAPAFLAASTTAVATTSILMPVFTAAATTTAAVEWEIDYLFGSTE